jgi:micrococcal nuclease
MSRRSRSRPVLPFRRRRKGPRWRNALLVAAPLATFALVFAWDGPPAGLAAALESSAAGSAAGDAESAQFAVCSGRDRVTCVVDGDTIWYRGDKIRIADINTPEVSRPDCAREAELDAAATQRLRALLNAGPFSLEPVDRDRDRYGRLLRTVTRDGASLGAVLVDEGLAEEWGGRRLEWC